MLHLIFYVNSESGSLSPVKPSRVIGRAFKALLSVHYDVELFLTIIRSKDRYFVVKIPKINSYMIFRVEFIFESYMII